MCIRDRLSPGPGLRLQGARRQLAARRQPPHRRLRPRPRHRCRRHRRQQQRRGLALVRRPRWEIRTEPADARLRSGARPTARRLAQDCGGAAREPHPRGRRGGQLQGGQGRALRLKPYRVEPHSFSSSSPGIARQKTRYARA